MRRGEIWWGEPGLPGGARKRRPFLIVSNDAFNLNEKWRKVMVVHLTTVAGAAVSWQVPVPRGVAGLPQPSTAKCAEVYTVFKNDLVSLVGTLPREYMIRIDAALQITLSIGP